MIPEDIKSTDPADETGKPSPASHPAPANSKFMVVAVGVVDGKLVTTFFDLETEGDDQSPLSKAERSLFKKSQGRFEQHRHSFEEALKALHIMFAGRLYREKFSGFEEYCFALHGMALPEDKLAKLKAKVGKLPLTPGRK